jgi:hypothetical protein
MMVVVMHMMMIHAPPTPPWSPAHGLFSDRLGAISRRLGIVGRLLGAAGRRLSLRRRRLSALRRSVSSRGSLVGLIGRVDRVLLWRRVARGAPTRHHREKQDGARQPNQF